jgi:anti-sigma regulatory factor (Ser/Thr protein kinase)/HAMP domain-containing protein
MYHSAGGIAVASVRARLRLLIYGLMAGGVIWLYLSNYLIQDIHPIEWMREEPQAVAIVWVGAALMGALLDWLAGRRLKPFFRALSRLQAGEPVPTAEAAAAAGLAMRLPEQVGLVLLVGAPLLSLTFHTVEAWLFGALVTAGDWLGLLANLAQEMVLTILLAAVFFVLGRRLVVQGIAAFRLREVPRGRAMSVGSRFLLLLLTQAVVYTALYVAASIPPATPMGRMLWIYLAYGAVTGIIGLLVATETGHDLQAIAARLQAFARGVRPDLSRRLPVTGADEVGQLVASINHLQDRVEEEFRTIERDLQAARAVQTGMLPRPAALPPGWDLAARLVPAREVGGDFYDWFLLNDGRLGIAVGDAAGKGLPAALLMAAAVSLLRSHAEDGAGPAEVLAAVNRRLCASLPPMSFTTAAYAIVDLERCEVRLASAGHLPPWIGGQEAEAVPALPLGVDPDTTYVEQRFALPPGEPLVLVSDGVIEAVDTMGQVFGEGRLGGVLRRAGEAAGGEAGGAAGPGAWAGTAPKAAPKAGPDERAPRAGALAEAVLRDVAAFGSPHAALAEDDCTVLVLIPPARRRLELPSRHGAELEAAQEAEAFARRWGPAGRAEDVGTAVGEACLNAAVHGNRLDPASSVTVELTAGAGWLEARVRDAGPPCDLPAGPPDLRAQMEGEGPIRGWGLHLMRTLADEVKVEPRDGGKQVCLRFAEREEERHA